MAITQATAFITSDGNTFWTSAEAELHEANTMVATDISAYAESLEEPMNARAMNLLYSVLPDFIEQMGYIKAPEQVEFTIEDEVVESATVQYIS